jgi:ankyrin repeat protein
MLQVARGVKKMKKLNKVVAVLLMPLVMVGCGAMNKNLHLPASEGDLDKVRMEIEGGRKVDTKDAAGQTALMYAAETGRIEVIEYLLSQGADVNAKSGLLGAGTALNYAAAANRPQAIELLLASGANVNAVSPARKESALMYAAARGYLDVVKLLLEKGADSSLKNNDDETALDLARKQNQQAVVQLLESL